MAIGAYIHTYIHTLTHTHIYVCTHIHKPIVGFVCCFCVNELVIRTVLTDTQEGFRLLLWPHCANLLSFESAVASYTPLCRCVRHAASHFVLCGSRVDRILITECSQPRN